jgi:hypothetical protein
LPADYVSLDVGCNLGEALVDLLAAKNVNTIGDVSALSSRAKASSYNR